MSHAGSQRATRLVSAGVPITDAFQAVVEEIIDNGPADFDTLNKRVQTAMFLKEKRILSAGWRTWDDFTRDILDQISGVDEEAVPTLSFIQGRWSLIEFTKGKAYMAIPRANIMYTVWDEETRLKRDADARMQMDVKRLRGDVQQLVDRYDWPEADRTQLKRNITSLHNIERRLGGVFTVPDEDDDDEPVRRTRVSQPKPEVVRGEAEWQRLTGCKMRYPVKELTGELAEQMAPGAEITLTKMTEIVNNRIRHIELHLSEPLGIVTSGTVLQALQGKNGEQGLVGDGVVERLEGVRPTTFRRL
jgi:hypothetical protein